MLLKYIVALEKHGGENTEGRLYNQTDAVEALKVLDLIARLDYKYGMGTAKSCT